MLNALSESRKKRVILSTVTCRFQFVGGNPIQCNLHILTTPHFISKRQTSIVNYSIRNKYSLELNLTSGTFKNLKGSICMHESLEGDHFFKRLALANTETLWGKAQIVFLRENYFLSVSFQASLDWNQRMKTNFMEAYFWPKLISKICIQKWSCAIGKAFKPFASI